MDDILSSPWHSAQQYRIQIDLLHCCLRLRCPAFTSIRDRLARMMDHIINVRRWLELGEVYARIPLVTAPHIRQGDALGFDWASVLPPATCSYMLGNPPFIRAKYQTAEQRRQVRRIAPLRGSGGTLDHATARFLKAGDYAQQGSASIGFVAANSITQGEQIAQLLPQLFNRCGLEHDSPRLTRS